MGSQSKPNVEVWYWHGTTGPQIFNTGIPEDDEKIDGLTYPYSAYPSPEAALVYEQLYGDESITPPDREDYDPDDPNDFYVNGKPRNSKFYSRAEEIAAMELAKSRGKNISPRPCPYPKFIEPSYTVKIPLNKDGDRENKGTSSSVCLSLVDADRSNPLDGSLPDAEQTTDNDEALEIRKRSLVNGLWLSLTIDGETMEDGKTFEDDAATYMGNRIGAGWGSLFVLNQGIPDNINRSILYAWDDDPDTNWDASSPFILPGLVEPEVLYLDGVDLDFAVYSTMASYDRLVVPKRFFVEVTNNGPVELSDGRIIVKCETMESSDVTQTLLDFNGLGPSETLRVYLPTKIFYIKYVSTTYKDVTGTLTVGYGGRYSGYWYAIGGSYLADGIQIKGGDSGVQLTLGSGVESISGLTHESTFESDYTGLVVKPAGHDDGATVEFGTLVVDGDLEVNGTFTANGLLNAPNDIDMDEGKITFSDSVDAPFVYSHCGGGIISGGYRDSNGLYVCAIGGTTSVNLQILHSFMINKINRATIIASKLRIYFVIPYVSGANWAANLTLTFAGIMGIPRNSLTPVTVLGQTNPTPTITQLTDPVTGYVDIVTTTDVELPSQMMFWKLSITNSSATAGIVYVTGLEMETYST